MHPLRESALSPAGHCVPRCLLLSSLIRDYQNKPGMHPTGFNFSEQLYAELPCRALTEYQQRCGRGLQHVGGGAAHQELADTGVAIGPHHQ